jgi:hypothetical protein
MRDRRTQEKVESRLYSADMQLERSFHDVRSLTEQHVLYTALSGIRKADGRIDSGLRWLRDHADDVETALENDGRLNELGEVGNTAREVDVAIAARAAHWETLAALLTEDEMKAHLAARRDARTLNVEGREAEVVRSA